MKVEKSHIFIIILVLAAVAFSYGEIDPVAAQNTFPDLVHYRDMASYSPGLPHNVEQPFIYWILGPYIAGLLPFSTPMDFKVLELASAAVLLILFYLYLCRLNIESSTSLLVAIFLLCNKFFMGVMLYNYFQVNDTLGLIFILLMFWSLQERKWTIFGTALFLGAMTRESSLIMIPTSLFYLLEKRILRESFLRYLFSLLPAQASDLQTDTLINLC